MGDSRFLWCGVTIHHPLPHNHHHYLLTRSSQVLRIWSFFRQKDAPLQRGGEPFCRALYMFLPYIQSTLVYRGGSVPRTPVIEKIRVQLVSPLLRPPRPPHDPNFRLREVKKQGKASSGQLRAASNANKRTHSLAVETTHITNKTPSPSLFLL